MFSLNQSELARLIELGALAQVTCASLLGGYGKGIERLSWNLCRQGLIHFISSDAHHPERRGICLADAYRQAETALGPEWTEYYRSNAASLIAGETISLDGRPAASRSSGWQRIRRLFS